MMAWELFVVLAGFLCGNVGGREFRVAQGKDVNLTTPGDSEDGCKFVKDPGTDTTCCYSASHRRQTLCDPDIQSPGCRMDPAFRVEEEVVDNHRVTVGCRLHLLDVQPGDAGQYLVIFPARLEDNTRMVLEVEVKENISRTGGEAEEKSWRTGDVVALFFVGTFVGTLFGIFIGKFYKKISFPAFLTQNNPIETPTKSPSNSPMMESADEVYDDDDDDDDDEVYVKTKSVTEDMYSSVKKENRRKTAREDNTPYHAREDNTPYQIGRRPRKGTLSKDE